MILRPKLAEQPVAQDFSPASRHRGYTFVEVAIVAAVVAVLASAALPLAKVTMQRQRELELRRSLREIRTAIDKYKDAVDQNLISPNDIDKRPEGYPPTSRRGRRRHAANDTTEGVEVPAATFLTTDDAKHEWARGRSRDEPDTRSWGGRNVYDVYTKFEGRGLDGTNYRTGNGHAAPRPRARKRSIVDRPSSIAQPVTLIECSCHHARRRPGGDWNVDYPRA